jgi:hypothetical protein
MVYFKAQNWNVLIYDQDNQLYLDHHTLKTIFVGGNFIKVYQAESINHTYFACIYENLLK